MVQQTGEGGTFGRCTIITTDGGKRIVTRLVGMMKPWGGIHAIQKPSHFLQVTYGQGNFTCRFVPSPEFAVGDCVTGASSGTCTVIKLSNGSKQYFKASASARLD